MKRGHCEHRGLEGHHFPGGHAGASLKPNGPERADLELYPISPADTPGPH